MSDELPNSVVELMAVIGESATMVLVKRLGGQSLFIADSGDMPPYFEGVIDADQWQALQHHYGSTPLYLPKCYRAALRRRNRKIQQLRLEGASIRDLVAITGLSDRQVLNICAKASHEPETVQLSLFDEDG